MRLVASLEPLDVASATGRVLHDFDITATLFYSCPIDDTQWQASPMTRGDQASDQATYDGDFYTWTQQQAAALRLTRDVIGASVDVEHVAEEIEDLGKRDLRDVSSYLARLIEHLIKLDAAPSSRDGAHWWSEAAHFQDCARAAFTPGMRQSMNVEQIWVKGRRATVRFFRDLDAAPSLPTPCPFTAGELLSADFDIDDALAKLAAARDTPRP